MLSTIVGATVGLAGFVVTVTVLAIQMATGTFSASAGGRDQFAELLPSRAPVLGADAAATAPGTTAADGRAWHVVAGAKLSAGTS